MPSSIAAELALDAHAELAECPLWDPVDRTLLWVDCTVGAIHRFDPATGADSTFAVGQLVGSVAWRRTGGLVLALRDGFSLLDPGKATPLLVAPVQH